MKSLNEIMSFYGTDKQVVDHNYVPYYEKLLEHRREEKLKILEIGIYRPTKPEQDRPLGEWDGKKYTGGRRLPGASLRTWGSYLVNSDIYGIDLLDFKDIESNNIKTFICNQESRDDLESLIDNIGGDFDIIIDDGGHTMKQHQISLATLFKYVKKGGVYVIEDLQTCNMGAYVKSGDESTVNILERFKSTGKFTSNHMTENETKYLENHIEDFTLSVNNRSGIVIIQKK